MNEIPKIFLFYQWGCAGLHSHHPDLHGDPPLFHGGDLIAHHHHDSHCEPPPILKILSHLCHKPLHQIISELQQGV